MNIVSEDYWSSVFIFSKSGLFSYQVVYFLSYEFKGALHMKEIGSLSILWVAIFPTYLFVF